MRGFVLLALLAASAHAEIQRPSAGLSSLPLRSKSSQGLTARRVLSVDHATAAAAAAAASKGELVRGGGADARGALSIAGGMMVHLALGTMYCWGNFMSYMPKSMLYFDGGAANGRTPGST